MFEALEMTRPNRRLGMSTSGLSAGVARRRVVWLLLLGSPAIVTVRIPAASAQDDLERLFEPRQERAEADPDPSEPQTRALFPEPPKTEPAAVESEPPQRGAEAPSRRVVEEIVVTAQKREESLQDVPISMSVLDEEFLRQENLTSFTDVARHIPNVKLETAVSSVEARIRGFTTRGATRSFEQAVGLTIDGIPYSRGDYLQGALFDIGRIEALRGPQGQLYGKNSTVGTLNVATTRPTEELTGAIEGQLGSYDRKRITAALGGPLIPGFLNFRVAGLFDENDGYIRNTTKAIDPTTREVFGDDDRDGARVKLEVPDLFGATLGLSYERTNFSTTVNGGAEILMMPEETKNFFLQFDPNTDFEPDNFVATADTPGFVDRRTDTIVANTSYDLAGWGIDALFGYATLDSITLGGDPTAARYLDFLIGDESDQTTGEIRLSSPRLDGFLGLGRLFGLGDRWDVGWTDFTAGFFYQNRGLDPVTFVGEINDPVLAALIALGRNPNLSGAALGQSAKQEEFIETLDRVYREDSDTFAGFGQLNWRLADRWTLLYGMRVSHETKDGFWNQNVFGPCGTSECAPLLSNSGSAPFETTSTRDEFNFSPKVGVKYDWSDELGFYATWATSFRGGGFNSQAAGPESDELEFDKETVRSWETGTKARLLGGAMSLDFGLFWMNLEDFQFTTVDPTTTPARLFVINSGEVRARGIEADIIYLPTDWLTLRGTLGFNDTEFLEFPFGPCSIDRPDSDGDGDPRCDLTGEPLPGAPKWNGTLTPGIRYPLTSLPGLGGSSILEEIGWTSSLTVEYQDTQFADDTLDPRTREGSFFRLDLNVGLENVTQGWSLGVTVNNLTDEAIAIVKDDTPLPQCSNCFEQVLAPPRLVVGRVRWSF